MATPSRSHLASFRRDVEALLKALKPTIEDDCRSHEEANLPSLAVTIGAELTPDGIAWNHQTGDNSSTGGAYGFPHWGIVDLHRRDNCKRLASDVVDQFLGLWAN